MNDKNNHPDCPFCGQPPDDEGGGYVRCTTGECPIYHRSMTDLEWRRRDVALQPLPSSLNITGLVRKRLEARISICSAIGAVSDRILRYFDEAVAGEGASTTSPLFSERMKIAKEVDSWLADNRVPTTTFGIVTALSALGYMETEAKK